MATKSKSLKVTLRIPDQPPNTPPVICTTSAVDRGKSFRKKTKITCYQNTADPDNPRLACQRMLVMDCDGVQSVGKSWESKIYGTQYMVGVLDRETGEMELRPAAMINMKPYVAGWKETEEERGGKEELGFVEKHKKLMMTFGDNRIQRTIRGKDRIREMESSTLDEAMQEAVGSVEETALTREAELGHSTLLPPINIEATELSDVFSITDFISQGELEALRPFTEVLRECTQAHVDEWREQKKYPEFVLSRLPVVIEDDVEAHLYLSQLLYLSYLITLATLKQAQLKKKKIHFPNTPIVVLEAIYSKFTSRGQSETGLLRTSISGTLRTKLMNYIAALTLIIDRFRVSYEDLSRDTGVKPRILAETYRSMGCSCKKVKKQDGSVRAVAVLACPVKLPALVLRKGGKKRE